MALVSMSIDDQIMYLFNMLDTENKELFLNRLDDMVNIERFPMAE